jgi:hypothetical protein
MMPVRLFDIYDIEKKVMNLSKIVKTNEVD